MDRPTPTNKQNLLVPPGCKLVPVEQTVTMTVFAAENLIDALVADLPEQLTRDRAESHARQAGIQQRINELLAIAHQPEGEL